MKSDLPYILAAAVCAAGIYWALAALHVLGAQPEQSLLTVIGQGILLVAICGFAILEMAAAICCIIFHPGKF